MRSTKRTILGVPIHATDSSVENGDVTILAVTEAVLLGLGLILYLIYGRSWFSSPYIFVGSVIALGPLSLQRTDRSEEIGLRYYDYLESMNPRVNAFQDAPVGNKAVKEIRLFIGFAYFLIIVPVWMWCIRPVSVVKAWFSGHFLESIFAIPSNWYRTVFVLDSTYPPESVPGIERNRPQAIYRCREHFWESFETLKKEQAARSLGFKFFYISAWLLQWGILFLPGATLRLGVKSTVLIWAPITALIGRRLLRDKDVDKVIDYIFHHYLERFQRWIVAPFQLIVSIALPVGLFAYKFVSAETSAAAAIINDIVEWSFGFNVVTEKVGTIQIWGWCSFIAAMITFALFHIASTEKRRETEQHLPPLPTSRNHISGLMLLRNCISAFVIFKPVSELVGALAGRL